MSHDQRFTADELPPECTMMVVRHSSGAELACALKDDDSDEKVLAAFRALGLAKVNYSLIAPVKP